MLRRLDCVLEPTKAAVLREFEEKTAAGVNPDAFLRRKSGQCFYNTSRLDLRRLMGDQDNIGPNLMAYVQAFSPEVSDIFERFAFAEQIDRLAKAKLLYLVTEKFAAFDLHPERVTNTEMGTGLRGADPQVRRESPTRPPGSTSPRGTSIRLMVNLLFIEDDDALTKPGMVRTIYDPDRGHRRDVLGGRGDLAERNPDARLRLLRPGAQPRVLCHLQGGHADQGAGRSQYHAGQHPVRGRPTRHQFDYMLSNPPFGVDWKKVEKEIKDEHDAEGFDGRFGPGLPRVSDGSLLFLCICISQDAPMP